MGALTIRGSTPASREQPLTIRASSLVTREQAPANREDALATPKGSLANRKVALATRRGIPLLKLSNGKQSGTVACSANAGLLVGTGASHPTQARYFNWQYTLDNGQTFVTLPPTTRSKTLIQGLTPLSTVGVRVSMTNADGPGDWSQVVTILVL